MPSEKAKKSFYWNKFKSCIGDSRQTFKLLNDLNGKTKTKLNIPLLDTCDQLTPEYSNIDIAEAFNKHCTNMAEELTKDISPTQTFETNEDKSMWLYQVTVLEVKEIINSLDNKCSSGVIKFVM